MAVEPPRQIFENGIADARHLAAVASTDDQWDEMWDALRALKPLGRLAFDGALSLLAGPYFDRAVGCDLLGALCDSDEEGWSHEAAVALVNVAEGETDAEVLWSVAHALNHAGDPVAVSTLSNLRRHPDRDIRLQVARAITGCQTFEDGEDLRSMAVFLLEMMEDEDPEVREWATFGVGSQLQIDGNDIRSALARRLEDAHPDARFDAILGLAIRHDQRVFEHVLTTLEDGPFNSSVTEAAGCLADPRLLGSLQHLASTFNSETAVPSVLRTALERCDPIQQSREVEELAEFVSRFDGAALASDMAISLTSDLFHPFVQLDIWRSGQNVLGYTFGDIVRRGGGDLGAVLGTVMSDLHDLDQSLWQPKPAGGSG